nr:CpaF family protein [Methanobrevibacter arboriphilus]
MPINKENEDLNYNFRDSGNSTIPKYELLKTDFSETEKFLLEDLRDNLVDKAVSSGKNFRINEKELLNHIKDFLTGSIIKNKENVDDYLSYDISSNQMNHNDIKLNSKNNIFKNVSDKSFSNEGIDKLANKFFKEIIGYGELDSLISDDELEEIMIIGINKPVFVYHRDYGMMESNLIYNTDEEILSVIESIARQVNRRIDQESPIMDARLENGSRVNATIPPISADGPSLTIRKFKKDPLTIIDIINENTLSSDLAAFLWLCVDGLGVKPANTIISGGTSSGKTTTLNSLTAFINPRERIITIEDTLELQIPHQHVLRMETRNSNIENRGELTMDDLVKNSLRQRPDRIILGEVRGKEAVTLFTALNTGHSGFGTLHSNSSRETITRLTNAPMNVPKVMISAIDFIIMQNRIYRSDGVSVRRVTEVVEVVGIEEGTIQLNKIFNWNSKSDEIENVSISCNTLQTIANIKGIKVKDLFDEIDKRKRVLNFLSDNNIRNIHELNKFIGNYYLNPFNVLDYISNA